MRSTLLLALAELTVSDYVALGGGLLTLLCLVGSAAWWCSAIRRDVHSIAENLSQLTASVTDHERRLTKAHL
jgi:hypothetical protein